MWFLRTDRWPKDKLSAPYFKGSQIVSTIYSMGNESERRKIRAAYRKCAPHMLRLPNNIQRSGLRDSRDDPIWYFVERKTTSLWLSICHERVFSLPTIVTKSETIAKWQERWTVSRFSSSPATQFHRVVKKEVWMKQEVVLVGESSWQDLTVTFEVFYHQFKNDRQ